MDVIREHLIYSNVAITICLGTLKPQEQYECIRLLLATRTKDVKLCTHNCTNKFMDKLLTQVNVQLIDCADDKKLTPSPFPSTSNSVF
jgi:hypothetical protein